MFAHSSTRRWVLVIGICATLVLAVGVPQPADAQVAPAITGVAPASGSAEGGTQVTIAGTGFLPGAAVDFSGAPAATVTVVSSTQILVTAPRGSVGSVNVRVINTNGGVATLNSGFFYS